MNFVTIALSSWASLVLALVAGVGLGLVFFGGLWWTVNRLQHTRQPGLLFAGSFLVRTALVLAGIYIATGGQWQRVALCVLGFIAVRMVMTRRLGLVDSGESAAA